MLGNGFSRTNNKQSNFSDKMVGVSQGDNTYEGPLSNIDETGRES